MAGNSPGGSAVNLTPAERLAEQLERMRIAEYVAYLQRPRRVIYINFIGGLAGALGWLSA